jgi:hypothetical protein
MKYKVTAVRMLLYNYTSWTEKQGQILEIKFIRAEKISKILDRKDFCRLNSISRRILLLKQNNSCSVFLTKF